MGVGLVIPFLFPSIVLVKQLGTPTFGSTPSLGEDPVSVPVHVANHFSRGFCNLEQNNPTCIKKGLVVRIGFDLYITLFFFKLDQYQYLGNCPHTPPLTQQQSIDNKLG